MAALLRGHLPGIEKGSRLACRNRVRVRGRNRYRCRYRVRHPYRNSYRSPVRHRVRVRNRYRSRVRDRDRRPVSPRNECGFDWVVAVSGVQNEPVDCALDPDSDCDCDTDCGPEPDTDCDVGAEVKQESSIPIPIATPNPIPIPTPIPVPAQKQLREQVHRDAETEPVRRSIRTSDRRRGGSGGSIQVHRDEKWRTSPCRRARRPRAIHDGARDGVESAWHRTLTCSRARWVLGPSMK